MGLCYPFSNLKIKREKFLTPYYTLQITFRYTRENSWSLQAMNFKKLNYIKWSYIEPKEDTDVIRTFHFKTLSIIVIKICKTNLTFICFPYEYLLLQLNFWLCFSQLCYYISFGISTYSTYNINASISTIIWKYTRNVGL